jgi:hypothetical protein
MGSGDQRPDAAATFGKRAESANKRWFFDDRPILFQFVSVCVGKCFSLSFCKLLMVNVCFSVSVV